MGVDGSSLQGEGFTLKEFKEGGYCASDVKDLVKDMLGGEEAAELKSTGFEAADLKSAGFGAPELRRGGFSPLQLRQVGFSLEDFIQRDEEAARALLEERANLGDTVQWNSAGPGNLCVLSPHVPPHSFSEDAVPCI